MPDRPSRPNGSESDYGWLYGPGQDDATRISGPADDATRVQQRPDAPQQRPTPPPGTPPPGPQPGRSGGSGSGRRRVRIRWRRVIPIVIAAWLVFLVAIPFWAWSKVNRVDADPEGDRPGEQPGTTYLMVGSDSREGLTKQQRKQLKTGDAEGQRTDTIMMLHIGSGPATLISIPRDSLVPVPGYGTTKINAAYAYGGPKLLVQTIEDATGVRIDDYVEIGFAGFVNLVDAVGGVEICPKQAIDDPDAGLDIEKGCQDVDGATALGYARSRHSYDSQDLQRVQAQREVIGAIADEIKSPMTVLNPVRYFQVLDGAATSVTVSDDMGLFSAVRFAWNLAATFGGSGLSCTVPIADTAVHWDSDRAERMFGLIAEDRTDEIGKKLCTDDGLPR
ncbi:LCP family protein required for cell wall assembly [Mumia flava]|uniref:LCP family protein required for cell wall assembly n=1 Tax=Mumia flava TaxID=1348852 RepID=A0A0B2BNJ7_9ACTN|nr:LCP family protein [Mumia flava]PJJ58524.1 LCP family protein required for cell wall assembly [Mumia flava]